MNAKFCVPVILILIGISCIAYGTWSWAGATAWCASYDDGWAIASDSVGWGGMVAGGWSTYAALGGFSDDDSGVVQGSACSSKSSSCPTWKIDTCLGSHEPLSFTCFKGIRFSVSV